MGAVPLAGAIAQLSWIKGHPIAAFFVRKKPKEHGARLAVEGLAKGESLQGKRVVIVEDVTTTGGSALKAVEAVRDAGGEVALVFTMVDRDEGATETFARGGPSVSLALQGRRIFEGLISTCPDAVSIVPRRPGLMLAHPVPGQRDARRCAASRHAPCDQSAFLFGHPALAHSSFTIPH